MVDLSIAMLVHQRVRENELQRVSRSTSNYWRDLKGKAESWAWQRFDLIPCWILMSGLTCEANNWERFTNPAKSWPSWSDLYRFISYPRLSSKVCPCQSKLAFRQMFSFDMSNSTCKISRQSRYTLFDPSDPNARKASSWHSMASWVCLRWFFIFPMENPPFGESIVKIFYFLGTT